MRGSGGQAEDARHDRSFLAPAGALADWRMVLAYGAAAGAGVPDALPGTLAELAARCDLDPDALRAVLGLLAAWGIVTVDESGRYATGPEAPVPPDDAVLVVHAAVIRRWAALLGPRLADRTATSGEAPEHPTPGAVRQDLLARNARRLTRPLVDACLQRFPGAERVLDLGGGHGEHSLELARRGLRPTLQDRPAVIETARGNARLASAGVELFAGDLFMTLPPGPFDLVLLAAVTNMFDEPRNRDLYRRCGPSSRRAAAWRSSASCAAGTRSPPASGCRCWPSPTAVTPTAPTTTSAG